MTAKAAPVPPEDWPNARLDSVPRFLLRNKDWLEAEAAKSCLSLHCKTPAEMRAAVCMLSAQVRHWRSKAKQYDDLPEEIKSQQAMAKIREIFAKNPDAFDVSSKKKGQARNRWGSTLSVFYDWHEPEHSGAELRNALGYEETQFRNMVRRLKIEPLRRGRENHFLFDAAAQLLEHRLLNTAKKRRRDIAQQIWERIRRRYWRPELTDRFEMLRQTLFRCGAECEAPARPSAAPRGLLGNL